MDPAAALSARHSCRGAAGDRGTALSFLHGLHLVHPSGHLGTPPFLLVLGRLKETLQLLQIQLSAGPGGQHKGWLVCF